jgi:hypothetical protein
MDDEEIIAELVRVRGIGRWTAEMFLMFNLRRPDVLPVDDLGFRNALAKAYGMKQPPTAKEVKSIGERWRPYRSAAVWYLWQSTRLITVDAPATVVANTRKIKPKLARVATANPADAQPNDGLPTLPRRRSRRVLPVRS